MSCKLKLYIPKEKISQINKDLSKKYEVSGVIYANDNNEVVSVSTHKGDSDSVQTPNHIINYHTHPSSAYKAGETIWGWPSGEDVRETIRFSLQGNKAHMVFTMEGVYSIQVSPCKLKKMKKLLTSVERGVLVFLIEEYFKTSHNFRGRSEVKTLGSKGIKITPYSYVDFINNFDLSNLLSTSTILHKKAKNDKTSFGEEFSKIPNIGFPELENNYIASIPLKEYISDEDLEQLKPISKNGEDLSGKISKAEVLSSIKRIFKKFKTNKCTSSWNSKNPNAWFYVNFFEKDNPDVFIKIFSNTTDGCSMSQIGKIHNFEVEQKSSTSEKSSFGNESLTGQQRYLLYTYLFNESGMFDTEHITNKLNEIKGKSIPTFHVESVEHELKPLKKIIKKKDFT
jgi:hypothetical protein